MVGEVGGLGPRRRRRERMRRRARLRRSLAAAMLLAAAATAAALTLRGGSQHARPTATRGPMVAVSPVSRWKPHGWGLRRSPPAVPILMYHVIAPPVANAPFPGLYVDPGSFRAQMDALARAGYDAVTLDQVRRAWLGHGTLPRKPVVLSFDNGYRSQYTAALPVLERLGWVGVENLQLTGLPPSQGGLAPWEVRRLVASGWELDTQGESHADLVALDPAELRFQVVDARRTLRREYHVPVNWFCYPSGYYDMAVASEVAAAGFVGSTTVVPGWASPDESPFTLPRLRVLRGTTPDELLQQIGGARFAPPPPASYPD